MKISTLIFLVLFSLITKSQIVTDGVYYSNDGFLFSNSILLKDNTFKSVWSGDMGSYKSKGVFTIDSNEQKINFIYKNKRIANKTIDFIMVNGEVQLQDIFGVYKKGQLSEKEFTKRYKKAHK